jgi:putative restriction endonuclease
MTTVTCQDIRERVDAINVWKRHEERAVHKPLLLLLALARIVEGKDRLVLFKEIAEPLARLIEQFGPARRSVHAEYPFWRLQNDGLWEIPNKSVMRPRESNTDPPKSEFIKHNIVGGFPEPVYAALRQDRALLDELVSRILATHFATSQHESIRTAVGLPPS